MTELSTYLSGSGNAPNNQASAFNVATDTVEQDNNTWLKTGVVETNVATYPDAVENVMATNTAKFYALSDFTAVVSMTSDGTRIWCLQGNAVVGLASGTDKYVADAGFTIPEVDLPAGITYCDFDSHFYVLSAGSSTKGFVYKYTSTGVFVSYVWTATANADVQDIGYNTDLVRFGVISDEGSTTRISTHSINGTEDENTLVGTNLQVSSIDYLNTGTPAWYFADKAISGSIRRFNSTTWADLGNVPLSNSTDQHAGLTEHQGEIFISAFGTSSSPDLEKRSDGLGDLGTVTDALPMDMGSNTTCRGMVWDGSFHWLLNFDRFIYQLDVTGLSTGTKVDFTSLITNAAGLAWDGTFYWLLGDGTAHQLNSSQIATGVKVNIPNGTVIEATASTIYVADAIGTLTEINNTTYAIEATYDTGISSITAMFHDGTNIWLGREEMHEFDVTTKSLTGRYLDWWNQTANAGTEITAAHYNTSNEWIAIATGAYGISGVSTPIVGEKRAYTDPTTDYPIYIKVK